MPKSKCPDKQYHNMEDKEPSGYVAWFEWAEKLNKTHEQKQCPTCGLYTYWVPRRESAKRER